VELVGQGGLLTRLTKSVFETALEAEMTEHLGYDKHDPMGRNGGNSRNGTRTKTVVTEIGPVDIEVPRDRDGSFAPAIVRQRQRRLDGVDDRDPEGGDGFPVADDLAQVPNAGLKLERSDPGRAAPQAQRPRRRWPLPP
jgi:hypothetical protein